ncbi:hypothetical protein Tco_0903744, partial [Tanacetum coccineum]
MVTIPPSTGNFSIPWAVDGTARIAEIPGLPIMPLYGDGRSLWKQCSYSMPADAPPSMYMRWMS